MSKGSVRGLTRREFLKIAGTGVAGASLLAASGCDPSESKTSVGKSEMNVVLVIIDSLRRDHVGAYGNDWVQTPALDALAKESLRFTRPYSESMPTIPVRRAIHTGIRTFPFHDDYVLNREPRHGSAPIPEGQTTLAEIMKSQGRQTFWVTDAYLQFRPGMNFQRGFDVRHWIRGQERDRYKPRTSVTEEEMQKYLPVEEEETRAYLANTAGREGEKDWFAPQVFLKGMEFLEQAAEESQPFFLVVDNYDPHEPWDPPEEYTSLYDRGYEGREPFTPVYGEDNYLTERQLQRMRALYSGELTMMDRWLGRFLKKMDELDLSENTLLVVISDHGVALGEHGYTGKPAVALWRELTDTIFLIRHPEGRRAGETSDYYASTHDVAPTILGFLGIEPPKPMDGQDLSVLFGGGEPEARDYFTLSFRDFFWARDERYVFFSRNNGDRVMLYDLENDGEMSNNIAAEHPDIVEHMIEDYILRDAGASLPIYGAQNQ